MTAQHTPGPWTRNGRAIEQERSEEGLTSVIAWLEEEDIADLEEANANARLIAAAPDLLEALQGMLAHYTGGSINNPAQRTAYRAIEKATGRPAPDWAKAQGTPQ